MGRRWTLLFQLLGVGWYIVVAIVLGLLAGQWLDGTVGTSPLFTLIGLFVGLVAALAGAYRMVIQATTIDR